MDASRAQRRMEVAARIKELRAAEAAQHDPSPQPAGDLVTATAVAAPPASPAAPELTVQQPATEPAAQPDTGSAATTLADMLRSGGGLFN